MKALVCLWGAFFAWLVWFWGGFLKYFSPLPLLFHSLYFLCDSGMHLVVFRCVSPSPDLLLDS